MLLPSPSKAGSGDAERSEASSARIQVATKHRESLHKLQVADVPRGALSNQDTQSHLALSGGDSWRTVFR